MVKLSAAITVAEWIENRKRNSRLLKKRLESAGIPTMLVRVEQTDDRSIWLDQKRAWLKHTSFDSTHHIVIQDDVKLCENFAGLVHQAIQAKPNVTISCYTNHVGVMERAKAANKNWVAIKEGIWGVALLLPCDDIQPLFDYVHNTFGPKPLIHEPPIRAWQSLEKGEYVWCPAPCLVQHMAPNDSSVGNSGHDRRTAGWFEDAPNPDTIDYTDTADVPRNARGRHAENNLEYFVEQFGTDGSYLD